VTFNERYGPWALVTGASSGIGAEFARQLGEIGLNVAIVAWRRPRLEELAHELEAKNRVRVKIIAADLSQSDFLSLIPSETPSRRNRTPRKQCWIWLGEKFLRPRTRKGIGLVDVNCRVPLVLVMYLAVKCAAEARRNHLCVFRKRLATPYEASYAASKLYEFFFG